MLVADIHSVGVGAAIAVVALAVVLFDDGGQDAVEPQADNGQQVTAAVPQAGGTAADRQAPADTSDGSAQDEAANPSAADAASDQATAVEIDLAQVTPDGEAVFAGKAAPFAEVTVFEGDIILGRTTANEDGEWVVVSERALGPGEHLVSVGSKSASGETEIANLTLAIKVGETEDEQPLVALLPQSETDIPELLQSPDDKAETNVVAGAAAVPGSDDESAQTATVDVRRRPVSTNSRTMTRLVPALAPRSLSWKTDGALVIDGVSRGGVRVVAAAAGRPFAEIAVAEAGAWRMTGKVDAGRASRVMTFALQNGEGAVVATYELPVATRDLSQGLDGSKLVIVQQGDALWRIAYRSYGEGIKYVDIVRRNAAIDTPT